MILTTKQVADALGVTTSRVIHLIRAGRLPAKKFGVQWVVERKDLAKVRVRKPGRPRKTKG